MSESKKYGILITNLGTPDAPTKSALKRYLAQFLWDPRVVDLPRPLWWLILNGIILQTRPAKSAAAYREVWTEEGSPLLVISRQQLNKLQQQLAEHDASMPMALGMRYGNPSIGSAIDELLQQGVTDLVVLPLYPQNSCSTTASTFDAVAEAFRNRRDVPSCHFISDYHDDPGYIRALASSVREAWLQQPAADKLIFSFHGTPERFRDEGDLYYQQCLTTAQRAADELGLEEDRWLVTFQSRFGREEWLQPYTDETLKGLPQQGVTSVDILCPGFAADCLETIEEIGAENRDYFLQAGGERYRYIPALNDRDEHISALAEIVLRTIK